MKRLKNSKFIEIFDMISRELAEYGGKIIVQKTKYAYYRNKKTSESYFIYPGIHDCKNPIIVIGTRLNSKIFISTLIHEYCHFLQWKNQITVWKKYEKNKSLKLELEKDCEKKTVKLIKKLKLENELNLKDYIQNANTILWFYKIEKLIFDLNILNIRNSKIIDMMPDDYIMDIDSYSRISKDVLLEYLKL